MHAGCFKNVCIDVCFLCSGSCGGCLNMFFNVFVCLWSWLCARCLNLVVKCLLCVCGVFIYGCLGV